MNSKNNKTNKKPEGLAPTGFSYRHSRTNYNSKRNRGKFNRSLLPTPASYYTHQFPGLKIKSEWIKVKCCFHSPDKNPSLNINMVTGHFRCFSCGAKGCDVIAFHTLRYGMTFNETVTELGAWDHE
jgi:hypothetical protein